MLKLIVMILWATFMFNNHPLILSATLMMFSFLYGMILAFNSLTPWLAYMLIMIFLSGLMVIILYMTSLSSNENISFNMMNLPWAVLALGLLTPFVMLVDNKKLLNTSLPSYMKNNTFEMVYKTYSGPLMEATLLLIIYLLVVLIAAVKIISFSKGPMKFYK